MYIIPLLSKRVQQLQPSATLAMAKKARELKAKGYDVLSLSLGEPDFNTPQPIKNAAIEAIEQNFTHYPPVAGIQELRETVAHYFSQRYKTTIEPQQVIVTTGAKQAIINVFLALLNPGDEVLLPVPYWVSYYPMLQMAQAQVRFIPTTIENQFKVTPEQLERYLTIKTRLLILNSPNNPTGSVYTQEEISQLAEVLEKFPHVFILSDEIYDLIWFDALPGSWMREERLRWRVILIHGVSKAFAMTGWRIGFAIGLPELIEGCERIQGQFTSGACHISQKAAVAAFKKSLQDAENMRKTFQQRRDFVVDFIKKHLPQWRFATPQGAFYLYPDVQWYFGRRSPKGRLLNNNDDLVEALLEEAHVAVVSGSGFGTKEHIRLSFAASQETLQKALERIKIFTDGCR